jgi:hypothetical protein
MTEKKQKYILGLFGSALYAALARAIRYNLRCASVFTSIPQPFGSKSFFTIYPLN